MLEKAGFTLIVLIVEKVGSAKSGSDVLTVCRSRVLDDFTQIWQSAMTDRGRSVNMVELLLEQSMLVTHNRQATCFMSTQLQEIIIFFKFELLCWD